MDELFASLSRTLLDSLHVTPASSMRQDQWYKRCMESWKESNSGDVLTLTPKDARAEWAPKIYSFAKDLECVIRKASQQERETASKELSGDAAQGPLPQRAYGIKKLLERHESTGLLALATGHGHILRTLAELPPPKTSQRQCWEAPQGWVAALDETLEVLLFIMTMLCFEDQLLVNHGYARWLPAIRKYPVHPAVWTYLGSQGFGGIESRNAQAVGLDQKKLKDHLNWHLQTLSIAVVVMGECGIEHNPYLEDRIVNAFLHLSAKWLRSQVPEEKDDAFKEDGQSLADSGDEVKRPSRKKKDPLKLMEPGQNTIENLEEDKEEEASNSEEAAKLAAIETEEAKYGKKRSLKYRRKGHDSVTS
ncbi:hypothetical protein PG997_006842 [Apiospora hydei]|uniref:Uncharacterized protein n=1 Tax=Apiospora hydei TaxID=1337664 RepID=A0ABR1WPV2_9PEZI